MSRGYLERRIFNEVVLILKILRVTGLDYRLNELKMKSNGVHITFDNLLNVCGKGELNYF